MDLKEIRIAKGFTQEELAEKVGVIRQTISNIECGLSRPTVDNAKALAKVLEIEWTEFFPDEKVIFNDSEGEK